MAYTRRKRGSIRPLRRNARYVKRSVKARRRTKKRITRRPRKSFRAKVLDVSTRKKQDTMLAWNGTLSETGAGYASGPTFVSSGNGGESFLWVATARSIATAVGAGEANVNDDATRTASRVYMRGFKERIEIAIQDASPWRWRRVVFAFKGFDLLHTTSAPIGIIHPFIETSDGMGRLLAKITNSGSSQITGLQGRIYDHIFKGTFAKDWDNVMIAKTASKDVHILSDRMMTISSGNSEGAFRTVNRWYPINSAIIYDDFETGGGKSASHYSTMHPESIGDVYVVDFFEPLKDDSDDLKVSINTSIWWHER